MNHKSNHHVLPSDVAGVSRGSRSQHHASLSSGAVVPPLCPCGTVFSLSFPAGGVYRCLVSIPIPTPINAATLMTASTVSPSTSADTILILRAWNSTTNSSSSQMLNQNMDANGRLQSRVTYLSTDASQQQMVVVSLLAESIGTAQLSITCDTVTPAAAAGSADPNAAALLTSFYLTTKGSDWKNSQNWLNTNVSVCAWYGILCSAGARDPVSQAITQLQVTGISLPGNQLASTLSELTMLNTLLSLAPQVIELPYNFVYQGLPSDFGNSTSMLVLNLQSNSLGGEIPASISGLSSLEALLLSSNSLRGYIPASLGSLSSLRILDLHKNLFDYASIPPELGNLSQLEKLDLSDTRFEGSIPSSLGKLQKLTNLNISETRITGSIPAELGQLRLLKTLDLSTTSLTGSIPDSLGQLTALQILRLHHGRLTGSIPAVLGGLTALNELRMDGNELSGSIPDSLGQLINLVTLRMSDNQLTGSITDSIGNLRALSVLDFSQNRLTGSIPSTLGLCSSLRQLWLYRNQLSGEIPNIMGNLTVLETVDFSTNRLSGVIPSTFNSTSLQQLVLSTNRLTGAIPSSLGRLVSLVKLSLDDNALVGPIPDSLSALSALSELNLGENMLSGRIPPSLNQLTNLVRLSLRQCQLNGTIPVLSDMKHLEYLDLSRNSLSGEITLDLLTMKSFRYLDLSRNQLSGMLSLDMLLLSNSDTIEFIDLSYNQLGPMGGCTIAQSTTGGYIWSPWTSASSAQHVRRLYLDQNSLGSSKTKLGMDATTMMFCLGMLVPNVTVVGLSNVGLTGAINVQDIRPNVMVDYSISEVAPLVLLTELYDVDLSNNNLSSPFPEALVLLPTLTLVNLANTSLTGSVPSTARAFRLLQLSDNFNMRAQPKPTSTALCGRTELALSLDATVMALDGFRSISVPELGLSCPNIVGVDVNLLTIPPNFLNFQHCKCNETSYWRLPSGPCVPCPDGLSCAAAVNSCAHRVQPGYFPLPSSNDLSLLRIRPDLLVSVPQGLCPTRSACGTSSYSSSEPFNCASGHDQSSRLCSECVSGYFVYKGRCRQCGAAAPAIAPLFTILAGLAFLVYLYMKDYRIKNATGALLAVTFWMQASAVLEDTNASASDTSTVYNWVSSALSITPIGMDCASLRLGSESLFWFLMFSPLITLAVCVGVWFVGWRFKYRYPVQQEELSSTSVANSSGWSDAPTSATTVGSLQMASDASSDQQTPPPSRADDWLLLNQRVWRLLLEFFYMRVAERSLSTLACQRQAGLAYLPWRPEQLCSGALYGGMATMASLSLLLIVIGLPATNLWILLRTPLSERQSDRFLLGFLTAPLRPTLHWWSVALTGRKLVIALLIAVLPPGSTALFLSVLMVLAIFLAAHAFLRPYRRGLDNYLEMILLLHLIITFQTSLLLSVDTTNSYSNGEGGMVSTANETLSQVKGVLGLLGTLMLLSIIAFEGYGKIKEFWNRRMQKQSVLKMEEKGVAAVEQGEAVVVAAEPAAPEESDTGAAIHSGSVEFGGLTAKSPSQRLHSSSL